MGKAIILGASGFVGQSLVRLCEQRDIKHVAHSSKSLDLVADTAPAQIASEVQTGDTIILLSAYTPEKGDAGEMTIKNIQMVKHILDGIADTDIAQFIYISSDAVYPIAADMIDETTSTVSDRLYGYAHIVREQMLRETIAEEKLTILRPCAIYGNGDTHNAYGVMRFIRSAQEHKEITLFGGGEEYRDHVHVDDLAQVIASAYERQVSGIYNVTSGKSWRFSEIAELIKTQLGADISIVYKPRAMPIQHRHVNLCKLWHTFPDAIPRSVDSGINDVISQLS